MNCSFNSLEKKHKSKREECVFPQALKPYVHFPLCNGSILLLLISPPFFSLSSLLNHCLNLHARISSLIANPVFSLFLWPSHLPSIPHLWWCRLTALSETWDVYRWTVRVTAQIRGRLEGGFREWPRCHRDERPFLAKSRSVCVYLYQSRSHVCVCARVCVFMSASGE